MERKSKEKHQYGTIFYIRGVNKMIIVEYIESGNKFTFNSENKSIHINENSDYPIKINKDGIKSVIKLLNFIENNKLLD
jgi:hypothetical protein